MIFFSNCACKSEKNIYIKCTNLIRRDGRVVEGATLEMLYRGNSIAGSNPTLSAIFLQKNGGTKPSVYALAGYAVTSKASLHCAKHNFTSSRGVSRSSLNNRYALFACPP